MFLVANFILFFRMGKNGKKAGKNDEKNGTQASDADKTPDVSTASGANDTGVSQKLDTLLEVVKHMGEQLKQQDERLNRQEKMSIHDLLAVSQSTQNMNMWSLSLIRCHL